MFKEPTKKESTSELVQEEEKVQNLFEDTLDDKKETVNLVEIESKIEKIKEEILEVDVVTAEQLKGLQDMMDEVTEEFIKENKILDETLAIEELKNLKEEIDIQELEKDITEVMEQQMTNNDLYNIALTIRNDLYDMKKDELKIDNAILRKLDDLNGNIKAVNDKYSKTTFSIIAVFAVLFLLIGMQSEAWLPYVGNFLDFARTTTNIIK